MSDLGILQKPIPFGKYYLLEKINTGGMAEVFKAKTFGVEGFERLVAVKRILPAIAEDKEFIDMFIDEAKIAVQLNHANIAQIFDLGKVEDSYFIALEYVSGRDLKSIYDHAVKYNEKLSIPMVCYLIMRLCEGLDYAHNKRNEQGQELGIIHRDISPQNVLISYEGEVKLIDFGIAKAHGKSSSTQVGILKGKFSYMSPEQVRGGKLDRRCDIFSLGIVLYELLTLKRLFLGSSDFSTLEKIRKVEISPPTLFDPHIPQELEDIVLKSLARSTTERYQTAHEFQEAIHRFMFNQGYYFTNKDLSSSMKTMFTAEIKFEQRKLEYYSTLKKKDLEQANDSKGKKSSKGAGLNWDDDENETNVFDRPPGKKSKADVLASLDDIALPAGNKIVLAKAKSDDDDDDDSIDAPTISTSTLERQSLPTVDPILRDLPAPKPQQNWGVEAAPNITPHPTASLPPIPAVAVPANMAPNVVNSMYGIQPAAAPPVQARSNTGLIIALVVVLLALVGVGVYFFTRPTTDPNALAPVTSAKGIAEFALDDDTQALIKSRGATLKGSLSLNDQIVAEGVLSFPLQQGELEPGKTHRYTVEIQGFEKLTSTVVVDSGATKQLKIKLIPMNDAGFVLNVTPGDALVHFNDKLVPGAGGRFEGKDFAPGAYVLKVTHSDYFPYEQPLSIDNKTASTPLPIVLKPRGALTLTVPRLSNVSVKIIDTSNQQEVGAGTLSDKAPLTLKDLHPDRAYKILATHPDREPLELAWSMPSGQSKDTRELSLKSSAVVNNSSSNGGNNGGNNGGSDTSSAKVDPPPKDPPVSNPKPPDPKPPAGPPGILKIGSKPPSEVFINGESKGKTPLKIDLKPGKYKVKFVHPQKGEETKDVTVESGLERMVMHQWP